MSDPIKKTKSVILSNYNNNLIRAIIGIKTGDRYLPDLKPDQVLIKMEAAPCNPSDIAFIRGGYNIVKPVPAVPGFEGAGEVVETGNDAAEMLGKKVSSFIQNDVDGTWAEYFIANKKDCIVIKEELDIEQGACLAINPFTAYGLVEMSEVAKCAAIVQNAAGGQVAEFVRVLAAIKGIEVINIVRKKEQVNSMKEKGVKYILDSTAKEFNSDFLDLVNKLNPTMVFDAVGGEMTGQYINMLPSSSKIVLYGALAGGTLSAIDPMEIIFKGKKLEGFNLNDWIANKSSAEFEKISKKIQDLIINGKVKTEIQATFILDDVVSGIRTYIKSMSSGKVLFKP